MAAWRNTAWSVPINLREANNLLLEKGFHGVMRLDEVRQIDKLPVLGTGKTDYKVLRGQVLEEEGALR